MGLPIPITPVYEWLVVIENNPTVFFLMEKPEYGRLWSKNIGEQITETILNNCIRGENMSEKFIDYARFENDKIIKLAKEIVFNPNEPFDERFQGLLILLENAAIRIEQLKHGEIRLQQVYKGFCEKALNLHKQKRIQEFTERWAGKEVCEEMATEMKNIEKPNHCYKFAGIKVIEEDCNFCKKPCNRDNENYKPSSFMDLLDQKDEVPDGCAGPIAEGKE